jgi:hypothetical protein
LKLWNTKPSVRFRISASRFRSSRPTSSPASRYAPLVGRSRQPSRFMSVDFPDPDAPMTATDSPASMSSDTPASAFTCTSPVS